MNYNFSVFISAPKRVDIYLSTLFKDFSRSYIQKIVDREQVTINGKSISKNIKIKPRDEIFVEIKAEALDIVPEKMDLDIVFEDENIIILNKDSNTNVHPVPWEWWKSWTLVNGVLYYLKDSLPNIWWVERPWIVHRLDKDTTGLIMIAKNDKMMNYLQETIKKRDIWKYYLAIVHWIMKEKEFKIESYIGRDPNNRIKMTIKNSINPKLALTSWEVLEYIENKYSLLKIKIETWRTHQIRVHLASIGLPILWDKVYWNPKINKEIRTKYWLKRQALHASNLEIDLYWKSRKFSAELKPDMKKFIK